ncbi:hypothetical protein [Streptomyces sp. NPDC060031]|uniref:hypothetical protein n=1 Tax=Streptomyces sp. NPDC060031 TaxID=3347043 RepID=UPI00368A49CC
MAPLPYQSAASTVKAVIRAAAERLPADCLTALHDRLAAAIRPALESLALGPVTVAP